MGAGVLWENGIGMLYLDGGWERLSGMALGMKLEMYWEW